MFDIGFLYKDRIPEKSFYAFLEANRERLFSDDDFAALYVLDNGRPSVPPSLLATALLLQCHDKTSDHEACERAQYDLRWAHALGIPPAGTPFAKSTLQKFRAKMILSGEVEQIFRRSLEFASEEGFLRGRKLKVAVDTTPIFGAGAVKDTYNLLADGIRQVVRAIAVWDRRSPEEWADDNGMGRYFEGSIKGKTDVDWESDESRREFLRGIVDDARDLLQFVKETPDPEQHERLVAAADLLRDLLQQDVEYDDHGPTLRQGVARGRIISVHDPDMRHGRKSAEVRFDGYKGAIAVDTDTGLITAVDVVPAGTHDGDTGLALTEATEAATGMQVEETIGDAAYGDSTTRGAFEKTGRALVAKVPRAPRNGRIPKQDFQIDLVAGTCTCPAGQVTSDQRPAGFRVDRRGEHTPVSMFHFSSDTCLSCPLQARCTRGSGGRTIQVHPRETELRAAREFQRSEAFAPYKEMRQIPENRNARLKQLGAGKSRYRGLDKTRGQFLVAAAVANLTLLAALVRPTG